ncbi:MAG: hypothetical protein KIS78_30225 [Labilithrix sp.]|nr:hypothetical protein [Labilithrix sp.]
MGAPGQKKGRYGVVVVAALAVVPVVGAVVFLLLLPSIVRARAIAEAREAGFELTVDRVGVGLDGVTLRDVTAKATRTPGLSARVREIHLAGLSATDARVAGLEARLEGPRQDLEVGLAAILADHRRRFAGTPAKPRRLSIVGARLTWEGPAGERLAASDVAVDVESHGAGVEDVHGSVGRFELTTPKAELGPWASTFERSGGTSRVRVAFDPPVPDGPSALLIWPRSGVTELAVNVPRSSFDKLGVKPSALGLPAEPAIDVQLSLRGALSESARSELTFEATLWGLRPKGLSRAIDVHLEGTAASADGRPLELAKTNVTLGPFVAGVTGTVTPYAGGFQLDAVFKTLPTPCEQLARAEAKNMGPLAATLQALGQTTGALRVTGAVDASGAVTYDTAAPEAATLSWTAKETCGVSIFGM